MRYILRYAFYLSLVIVCDLPVHAQEQKSSPSPQPHPSPAVTESPPPNWQEFSSAEGGFKVLLPGIPANSTDTVDTIAGPLVTHNYVLETKLGAYFVAYLDLSLPSNEPEVIRRVLDGGRDEALSRGGKLLDESDITLDGIVGRELIVDKDGMIIRTRMFLLKGGRTYQAVFGTTPEVAFKNGKPSANAGDRTDSYEAISAKFFNSFRITPAAAGEVDALLEGPMGNTIHTSCLPPLDICKSGDILVSRIDIPLPDYPAIAKAAHVSGAVVIKIVVDEAGKVIASQVVSGHPLLHGVAKVAARRAQFAPPLLNGKPVKIVGTLTYNFVPE